MDTRYKEYRKQRRRAFAITAIVCLIIGIVSISVIAYESSYYEEKEYVVIVTEKGIKNYSNNSKFLIFTKTEDEKTKVFSIEDTIIKRRFNSADMYAEIEVGKKYIFTVIGFRIPFMSQYENIIKYSTLD